jgi:hypothetical protein
MSILNSEVVVVIVGVKINYPLCLHYVNCASKIEIGRHFLSSNVRVRMNTFENKWKLVVVAVLAY